MNSLSSDIAKKGITGSTLKLIAILTMLIDHIGATIVVALIKSLGVTDANKAFYYFIRGIGRLSFPLFIFLLIEGFKYTRSRWKYLLRLILFAFISEIPFDLAFNIDSAKVKSGKLIETGYQNVFFTLAIGFIAIMLIDFISRNVKQPTLMLILSGVAGAMMMALAELFCCDYGMAGVAAIMVAYICRKNPIQEITMICIALTLLASTFEVVAFLDVCIIAFYNGKKGMNLKWVFYIFYPAHLLVLWGIIQLLFAL